MKRKNFPIHLNTKKEEARVRQENTPFVRPKLCCQDCPLHANNPSRCGAVVVWGFENAYVGRKNPVCKLGEDLLTGERYTTEQLAILAQVRTWKHSNLS